MRSTSALPNSRLGGSRAGGKQQGRHDRGHQPACSRRSSSFVNPLVSRSSWASFACRRPTDRCRSVAGGNGRNLLNEAEDLANVPAPRSRSRPRAHSEQREGKPTLRSLGPPDNPIKRVASGFVFLVELYVVGRRSHPQIEHCHPFAVCRDHPPEGTDRSTRV
jgi:hypothetical protein